MIDFTVSDRENLLKLVRYSIESYFENESSTDKPDDSSPALQQQAGVFVTLHKKGQLRGCIGTFFADSSLANQVARMARSAAFEDSRFSPVHLSELPQIDIEISVLSPLREIASIEEIEVGTHGIYITRGFCRGVLLPQVATEHGWDRKTFLEHTCMKAGLPLDAWQKDATIEIFSALIIGENERELTR